MTQEDVVRFPHDQGLPAGAIHQRLVDLFGDKVIRSSTITRTIRQLSWMAPATSAGRPANSSVNAAILKVLNGDLTASVCEIAQEAKLSASTVFYALTTRIDYIHRRYRRVPHNLSQRHDIDLLHQIHEPLEILQNTQRLRRQFILVGDEFCFFYMNEHRKLWFRPDSESRQWRGH
jgi:hypothetical protein